MTSSSSFQSQLCRAKKLQSSLKEVALPKGNPSDVVYAEIKSLRHRVGSENHKGSDSPSQSPSLPRRSTTLVNTSLVQNTTDSSSEGQEPQNHSVGNHRAARHQVYVPLPQGARVFPQGTGGVASGNGNGHAPAKSNPYSEIVLSLHSDPELVSVDSAQLGEQRLSLLQHADRLVVFATDLARRQRILYLYNVLRFLE